MLFNGTIELIAGASYENCVPTVLARMPMVSAAKRAEPPPLLILQMSVVSECHDAVAQRELPMCGSGVVSSKLKSQPWTVRIEPPVPGALENDIFDMISASYEKTVVCGVQTNDPVSVPSMPSSCAVTCSAAE